VRIRALKQKGKICGTFFILKKMPQKVWQLFHFEKSATKSVAKFLI